MIRPMRTRFVTAALAALALACSPSEPEGPAPQTAEPPSRRAAPPGGGQPADFELPAQRELALDNGLQVTLVPYGDIPKAIVLLAVTAGNADEAANEVWLADLTGQMMEQGTSSLSAEQLAQRAAALGGELNVNVTPNQTFIGGDALSEHVPAMIALVADVAMNPAFPAAELDRLKGDMLRDISIQRSTPQTSAFEKFREVMYGDHPYGRIYPTEEMIQGYTLDQVRRFHDEHVGGARSRIYVVGRFDADAAERAVRAAFAPMERGAAADQPVPAPTSRRAIHLIDRPNAPQSTIILGLPVIDPSHPDWVALQVTNALLGGSFGSRITSNIREEKGYTYSPFSSVSTRPSDAYWAQQADVTTEFTGASLREIFYEIDRLRNEPPAAAELEGIQNYLAGTFVLQNSARGSIANQLAFVDLHGLPENYLETYVQKVYAVTPQDVQRIARTYLDPAQMQIVVVGDRSKIREQVAEYGRVIE